MSFVYAEKYHTEDNDIDSIRIYCDTKIGLSEYSSVHFSAQRLNLVKTYGIVKSTICCPELCISFAGNNILYAPRLFRELSIRPFELADVADMAYAIHSEAANQYPPNALDRYDDIEFIISYCLDGKTHIDCVKDGMITRDLPFAHIGSTEAFASFQNNRAVDGKVDPSRTSSAFDEVVLGCKDDSVGGRTVGVYYDFENMSFCYQWRAGYHMNKPQIVNLGENFIFDTSAQDGNYSYEVSSPDIQNVIFNIEQMKSTILYSRQFQFDGEESDNSNLFGLMLPMQCEWRDGQLIRTV